MADRKSGSLEGLDAPAEIRARIAELCEELVAAAGANLRGLILYGGLARGRYRPGKSDINLIVLISDASTESLAAIAPALRAGWRAVRVEPFIIKASEVARLAETFPTKLLDIQTHHLVLMGENPFIGIDVSRRLIRLRIEQSLTNLALRLRRRYISIFDDPRALALTLEEQAVPLKVELAALLQLAGKDEPSESTSAAVLESAAKEFGLDREALLLMAALRRDATPPEDLPALYNRALATISHAAEIVSRME
ncbi:MAG: nucleotidyltransferase domain-containing protein [Blastocatellia bacterium]